MSRYIDVDELLENMRRHKQHSVPVEYIKSLTPAHVVPASKWISVKERLPDESVNSKTRVLVALDNGMIDTDRIKNGGWVRWKCSITHWMPLPEPPKEEGENT